MKKQVTKIVDMKFVLVFLFLLLGMGTTKTWAGCGGYLRFKNPSAALP